MITINTTATVHMHIPRPWAIVCVYSPTRYSHCTRVRQITPVRYGAVSRVLQPLGGLPRYAERERVWVLWAVASHVLFLYIPELERKKRLIKDYNKLLGVGTVVR